MGAKEAAIYIDESKWKDWMKWCGDEVTQRGVMHCLAYSFGFRKPPYFSDIGDERLTEEQRSEGRKVLFDAIRKKDYKTVFTPDFSHLLRTGEKEADILNFLSQHNVRLITLDVHEMRIPGCSAETAKKYGVWKGKNRMERDDNPWFPPEFWGHN